MGQVELSVDHRSIDSLQLLLDVRHEETVLHTVSVNDSEVHREMDLAGPLFGTSIGAHAQVELGL